MKDNKNATDIAIAHITIRKLTSSLTINLYPSTIIIGNYTVINGTLTPQKEANITIYYKAQTEENWKILNITQTNSQGKYTYQWTPTKCGTYEIMASWKGDQETKPANSKKITVNVSKKPSNQPGLDLTQFYGILTLIAIIILGLSIYFYLKKRKEGLKT